MITVDLFSFFEGIITNKFPALSIFVSKLNFYASFFTNPLILPSLPEQWGILEMSSKYSQNSNGEPKLRKFTDIYYISLENLKTSSLIINRKSLLL